MIWEGHMATEVCTALFLGNMCLLYNYSLNIDLYLIGFSVYMLYFTIRMLKKLNENSDI